MPHLRRRANLDRRGFLGLLGMTTIAAGVTPFLQPTPKAAAQQPASVKVMIEDIRLDRQALSSGSLNGVATTARGIGLAQGKGRGEYLSPVLASKGPFTHIGLHWTAEVSEALSFEVRSAGRGPWSDWEEVAVEAHTPGTSGETFGALINADNASRVQFRANFATGRSPPFLQEVTVTLLNSQESISVSSLEGSTGTPKLTSGTVFSREDWKADEAVRFNASGAEIWPRMYVPVKKAVVHHTATTNNYKSVSAAMAEVRAIYTYHAVTLGWSDIGYNAIIDKWGNVYEGRHGRGAGLGREKFGAGVVAGHVLSHNYGSAGIALLGTFTKRGESSKPGIAPSSAMQASLADLLAWECGRNDLDPEAASDFLLFNNGWNRSLKNVPGHRDCDATICPGGYVYDLLPSIRSKVAMKLGRGSPSVALTAPPVDSVALSSADSLVFSWASSPSGLSFLYSLEGWRQKAAGSEDVSYLCGFDSDNDGDSASDSEPYADWDATTSTSATFGQLFDLFGPAGAEPTPGHYTFHVVALDSAGKLSYQRDRTLLIT